MSTYATVLQQSNGVIDDSVRKTAAKALVDDGAAAAAQQLGINTQLLTGYVTGNADATSTLQTKINAIKTAYDNSSVSVDDLGRTTHIVTQAQQDQYDAAVKLEKGLNDQKGALQGATTNQQLYNDMLKTGSTNAGAQSQALIDLAGQFGNSVSDYTAAVQAQKAASDQYDATTAAMQQQNDAAGILKQSLDKLNGKAISAAQAQNAFDSSLANMGDHVSSTGKKITFTTTSINDMSAASVALRGQLNGQVSNLEAVAEANGGFANSTGAARDQMVTMRQQIIDNAVAHGVNRDAVTQYIDKILQIPDKVPPTKLEIDKANADAAIEAFKQHLASINDRHVQVTTDYVSNGKDTGVANTTNVDSTPGIVKYNASGGQVSYLAGGGTPFPGGPKGTDTVPTWLTPGEIVMNTASVKSLGADNLLTANRTGQWPGGGQAPNITVYVTNPFTGEQVQAVVQSAANAAISGANRDARYRRAGV
jgi:hypothetical protein